MGSSQKPLVYLAVGIVFGLVLGFWSATESNVAGSISDDGRQGSFQPAVTIEGPGPEPFLTLWMQEEEKTFIRELMGKTDTWFEWGMGGSTATALVTKNINHIHAVDSYDEWYRKLSTAPESIAATNAGILKLVHVNIGKVKAYGYPVERDNPTPELVDVWRAYPEELRNADEATWHTFFVDGRFRVACALVAIEYIVDHGLMYDPSNTENVVGTLIIHDYNKERIKPHNYGFVEKYVEKTKNARSLASFRVNKATIDGIENFKEEIRKDQLKFFADAR